MKNHFIAVAGISIGILLTGCARSRTSTFPPEQSAIYVSREGALYTSLVRDYDPSDKGYNTEEITDLVSAYSDNKLAIRRKRQNAPTKIRMP